jgi:hypothetical protein
MSCHREERQRQSGPHLVSRRLLHFVRNDRILA